VGIKSTRWIWLDGKLVPWDEARVHVLAHAIHYGSSVFEGLRAYATPFGPAVLGLEPHVHRLFDSCKICRMPIPYQPKEISEAILEVVRANKLDSCYIRPLVFRGVGTLSLDPREDCPVQVSIAATPLATYLGEDGLKGGIDAGVGSWQRMAPNTFPALAKIGGQYVNSQLTAMEAHDRGFDEGIVMNTAGFVSEGTGENIFLVKDDEIITSPVEASILRGVNRAFVIQLSRDLGYRVKERLMAREMLYTADELFFTGTAVEITPVRSVDGIPVGDGQPGPLTAELQRQFFAIVRGQMDDRFGWMTMVEQEKA
jgi:branched-chain amino acid aminotransferase